MGTVFADSRWTHREVVTDGNQAVVYLPNLQASRFAVAVVELTAGSGNVEETISSRAHVQAATAKWLEWPFGAQTAPFGPKIIEDATALRFTAAGGDVTFEVMGIR